MASAAAERVLSIQSHVVYGYVGGKAAVFPLQCLGFDVDVVNTVHFSNHAGYGRAGGTKAGAAELNAIFESMDWNELMAPTRLLTGYVPGAEGLSAVAGLARKLKEERPEIIYLLDPVMGDAGRLYVAADVIPIYREMLPLATLIAPNWFEVETLTQIQLKDLPSLQQALKVLHEQYRVPNVVITSIPLQQWLYDVLPPGIQPPADEEHLLCITSASPSSSSSSSASAPSSDISTVHALSVPLIQGYFSGVGDLFSALLLAHFDPIAATIGDAAAAAHEDPASSLFAPSSAPSPAPSPSPSPPPSPPLPASEETLALQIQLEPQPQPQHEPQTQLQLQLNHHHHRAHQTPVSLAAAHALAKTHHVLLLTDAHARTLPEPERLPTDDEEDTAEPLRRTRRMKGRELRLVQSLDVLRGQGVRVRALNAWSGFWG
ncbi:putative pyridoxal kinase BUD16 [Hypsizygus marmoreus]|uniref:pyridoxal kinase n=1 Tax=Hypsizygus marmoreus TaxID=39966 RepID=A0A369JDH5_HYPMA|nr:putative pyridoxal kinase BUD16 [Hypsizygus marmoreus]